MNNLINFNNKEEVKNALKEALTLPQNISNAEMEMAINVCIKHQLNPFLKEIYLVPFGNKLGAVVNYLVMCNKVRSKYPNLKEKWEYFWDKDNKLIRVILNLSNGKNEVQEIVSIGEYKQNNTMWNSKPETMLQKVARAHCYRLLDRDFIDMYIPEEIQEAKELNKNTSQIPPKTPHLEQSKEIVINYPQNIKHCLEGYYLGDKLDNTINFDKQDHKYSIFTNLGEYKDYIAVHDFLPQKDLRHIPNLDFCKLEGSIVHNALSDWINDKDSFDINNYPSLNKQFFQNALNELEKLGEIEVVGNEMMLKDEQLEVAGTIDLLVRNKEGNYMLIDFKRTLNSQNKSDYVLQLYTYKQLLKNYADDFRDIDFNRKNFRIVLIAFGDKPHTFQVPLEVENKDGSKINPLDIIKNKFEGLAKNRMETK